MLKNVKNLCINAINNYNFNNHEELRNIIQDNLEQNLNGKWWVYVGVRILNNFGNIDKESVMIFQNLGYFIHVATFV